MAKKVTINRVRVELQAIQQAHDQLNEFHWGDFLVAIKRKETRFPLMCCYKVNGTMLRNTSPLNLIIIVADRVYKGSENENDTESDTHQVLRDIKTIITRSERWNALGAVEIIGNVEGFKQRGADEVDGHILRITMRMNDSDNICDLPLSGYDFGEQYVSTDPPTIIINSDQTFMQALAAGSVYELPDVVNVDSDGQPAPTPAQTPFVCTPQIVCQPVTYSNSNNTFAGSVPAGGNLPIPNSEITDTYGDTVQLPATQPFTCTAAADGYAENSDASLTITVQSGETEIFPDTEVTVKDEDDNILAVQSLPSGVPGEIVIVPGYEPETIDFMTRAGIAYDATSYPTGSGSRTGAELWDGFDVIIKNAKANIDLWSSKIIDWFPRIGNTAAKNALGAKNILITTWFGGVTHNSFGVLYNGINGYGKLGINNPNGFGPAIAGLRGSEAGFHIYSRQNFPTAYAFGTGSVAGTNEGFNAIFQNNLSYFCVNGVNYTTANFTNSIGLLSFVRHNTVSQTFYKNSVAQTLALDFASAYDTTLTNVEMTEGACNQPGGSIGGYSQLYASSTWITRGLNRSETVALAALNEQWQTFLFRGGL